MSEWFKEHAWKVFPATCTEQHPRIARHSRVTDLRPSGARRCDAVFAPVRRSVRADVTQFLHNPCFDLAAPAAVSPVTRTQLDRRPSSSHITSMALSLKKATTIALDPEDDRLLTRAARERGVSRAEFIRQHLALVLEQYRRHPKPRSAGIVRTLTERGDERELFSAGR